MKAHPSDIRRSVARAHRPAPRVNPADIRGAQVRRSATGGAWVHLDLATARRCLEDAERKTLNINPAGALATLGALVRLARFRAWPWQGDAFEAHVVPGGRAVAVHLAASDAAGLGRELAWGRWPEGGATDEFLRWLRAILRVVEVSS